MLVLAGSRRMLGAAALTSLAAIRSGAGLVTLGVPQSLNTAAQKKISNAIMTLPLPETKEQALAFTAFKKISENYQSYNSIAIGPGLSRNASTRRLILRIIETSPLPLVIDADALNALHGRCAVLKKTKTAKILTPHAGEMSRLIQKPKQVIEKNRQKTAQAFARKFRCTLLLKGAKTVVASPWKKSYTNQSGNAGMATAGSGDVLTGIIAAFLAQGLPDFEAAKYGAYLHGKAGDLAARSKTKLAMIAPDIVDHIPDALRVCTR
ncbi:MAG: NAD(P)H-hydrate dehydratase [Omnitrophica WOR_2 bacterium RIFCSPHIGHO2_02_FULL_52_10]|nr:MAG: NAD(P)H-hydrate dehydratase [Omnitrophica WOR_2 bacterium RIFCSPHIGHO2_02_FULL_52_10]